MQMVEDVVRLSGDPRSRGVEHGRKLALQIKRLLSDDCARINCHLPRPVPEEQIYAYVKSFASEIELELPSIAAEIEGLAEGAEISYEQAVLLQVRREVLMRIRNGANSDCSSFSLPINSRVIAQTVDLNSSFAEFGTVFKIAPWCGTPEILMFSFAGLLGYLGMNSSGLAIAINMVSSDDWRPGVPPYLLVRHLLELHTVEECLQAIASIRRSSSRSLTICDSKRSVTVEMTATSFTVLEGKELFHTNHYLSPDLIPKDTINFLARHSSVQRLSKLRELTIKLPSAPTTSDLFDLFADHENYPVGLCSHSDGDLRRTETVATVVMHPTTGTMYVRKGMPCCAHKIEKYTLADQKAKPDVGVIAAATQRVTAELS
ncbi:MAG: C45 family peptidase [Sideroxyarcus sp.]|nr:C45 family peptidase [Sideroxyarcus sp.]